MACSKPRPARSDAAPARRVATALAQGRVTPGRFDQRHQVIDQGRRRADGLHLLLQCQQLLGLECGGSRSQQIAALALQQ